LRDGIWYILFLANDKLGRMYDFVFLVGVQVLAVLSLSMALQKRKF